MFTPQEVSEKAFPKASFGGYSMSAVDEFLDTLTEDYTALYKENATLKAKLKVLAEKVEEYRATEDAMRSTLLTAQRMAAQMVQDAKSEKDRLVESCRAEVAQEVAKLDAQRAEAEQKLAMAQEELASFIDRSRQLCEAQTAFLAQLPELQLAAPAADISDTQEFVAAVAAETVAEESVAEEVAPAVEESAVEEVAPAVAEEAAPAPAVEEVPLSEAFKLDLGELKFGRNYTGEK